MSSDPGTETPEPSPVRPLVGPARPLVGLLIATVGYGLTFWAWMLIGPLGVEGQARSGFGGNGATLLAAVAVAAGSMGRIPVGVLADRYGPRAVLTGISAAAVVPVLILTMVDSGPGLIPIAVALGAAGTTFAAGSALVIRDYPPRRRGLAMSVYGAGLGIASAAALSSLHLFTLRRGTVLLVLAGALAGHAVLSAVLLRGGPVGPARRPHNWRLAVDVLRLPATRNLSFWYAVSLGGVIALGLYLPAYLRQLYGLGWDESTLYAAACVTVAALGRPVGGWLCQSRHPVPVLRTCFAGTAMFGLLLAFQPPFLAVTVPALLGIATLLGVASGVVLAVLGATAPPERAGVISGAVGAVGGLAGLLPPVLLATVYGVIGSYGIGLTLLAGAALGAAAYLYTSGRWIGAALAFPATTAPEHTATTVVSLPATRRGTHPPEVISALTLLATRHELVIVTSVADRAAPEASGFGLVTGLRMQLPRHQIVALIMTAEPHPHESALVASLLNDGALPVVFTGSSQPDPVAVLLAGSLGANHVLRVTGDQIEGTVLRSPWAPTMPAALADAGEGLTGTDDGPRAEARCPS